MNELQIINVDGVECYEKDGTAYLKLETVARGLGFTESKNGKEYVMWRRVDGFNGIMFRHFCRKARIHSGKHILPSCHESQKRSGRKVPGKSGR